MRLKEMREILGLERPDPGGFRVCFERRVGGLLFSDSCPDRSEAPLPGEEQAWLLAGALAGADPEGKRFVNIYVVDSTGTPVIGYRERMLNRHPRPVS